MEKNMRFNFEYLERRVKDALECTDLEKIRYIDYSYWNELSAGTHKPLVAAETIRRGVLIYDLSNDGFLRTAEHIKNGGTFPKLFFLTSDYENFVIVEV
jgi:hypothetical protein